MRANVGTRGDRLISEPGWRDEIGHIPAHGLEGID
jgi:hypothetical protein